MKMLLDSLQRTLINLLDLGATYVAKEPLLSAPMCKMWRVMCPSWLRPKVMLLSNVMMKFLILSHHWARYNLKQLGSNTCTKFSCIICFSGGPTIGSLDFHFYGGSTIFSIWALYKLLPKNPKAVTYPPDSQIPHYVSPFMYLTLHALKIPQRNPPILHIQFCV